MLADVPVTVDVSCRTRLGRSGPAAGPQSKMLHRIGTVEVAVE
jgi:hypothetical protein